MTRIALEISGINMKIGFTDSEGKVFARSYLNTKSFAPKLSHLMSDKFMPA